VGAILPTRPRAARVGVAVAAVGTLGLGLWLRWFLAGRVPIPTDFAFLRHAHSHLGYYGLLFPAAWWAWAYVGAATPGPRLTAVYGAATLLATVGFVRAGYGPEAIVGSTIVGVAWLVSAARVLRPRSEAEPSGGGGRRAAPSPSPLQGLRPRSEAEPSGGGGRRAAPSPGPLTGMLPAVVLAEACVPPIAIFLRRDPVLAHGLVTTFLTMLLLGVVVPSVLATRGLVLAPWPVTVGTTALVALHLGAWASPLGMAATLLYAALVVGVALRGWRTGALGRLLALSWGATALGTVGLGLGLLPNLGPVAVGATHFLVLSPVALTVAERALPRPPGPVLGLLLHLAAVALTLPLLAQGLGVWGWPPLASAVGGLAVVGLWAGVGLRQLRA
jgi:hypothetical protein